MQKNFLEEVIKIVIGSQGEKIVDLLDEKKYVNEFLIAKKLDLTINQTRNILYRLSEHGLVSSIRKKDRKKGWYTYFWKIESGKVLEFLKTELAKRVEQLKNQIKSRETKVFYQCEGCNVEYNEENALTHNFTCEECGNIFVLKDNSKIIKEMKKGLEKLTAEIEIINKEILSEKEKSTKKIEKETKKIAKRKREEREKAKKLLKKKNKIKVKVKKTKKQKHLPHHKNKKLKGKKKRKR